MKIQPSALVNTMSGKHSGGVMTKGISSLNCRRKVRPHQPSSNLSSKVRARLASVQAGWGSLTASQVAGWNSLAKQVKSSNVFGDKFTLTGISLYQRLNNNLVNAGVAMLTDAPTLGEVSLFTTFTATAVHAGAVTVTFAHTPLTADEACVLKATTAIPVGRKVKKSDFRQIAVLQAADTSPYTGTTAYNSVFTVVGAAGKVVYFEAYIINKTTGQAGRPVQCSAVIS